MSRKLVPITMSLVLAGGCSGSGSPGGNIGDPELATRFQMDAAPAASGFLFVRTQRGCCHQEIFELDVRTRSVTAVNRLALTAGRAYTPILTSNGMTLIFGMKSESDHGFFAYDRISGAVNRVVAVDQEHQMNYAPVLRNDAVIAWIAAWFEDDQLLRRLFVARLDGSQPATMVPSPADTSAHAGAFMLSPDGETIVWFERVGFDQVLLIRAPTQDPSDATVLLEIGTDRGFPSPGTVFEGRIFGPDLRFLGPDRIYFLARLDEDLYFGHYLMDPNEPGSLTRVDEPVPVGARVRDSNLHSLPDGRILFSRLVESDGEFRLTIKDIDRLDEPARTIDLGSTEVGHYRLDRDARWLAYSVLSGRSSFSLYLLDLDADDPVRVNVAHALPAPRMFELDANSVLFLDQMSLFRVVPEAPLLRTKIWDSTTTFPLRFMDLIPEIDAIRFYGNTERHWMGFLGPRGRLVPLVPEPPLEEWREELFIPAP